MKATFAFIPDLATQNAVTALGWELHVSHRIPVRKLPPHVSLKQPFDVSSLPELLDFMEEFTAAIQPVEIGFGGVKVWPYPSADEESSGVIVLEVNENSQLRALHSKLNEMLSDRFGDCWAPFDGPAYQFHLTLALGGPEFEHFRAIAKGLTEVPTTARLEALALFVYHQTDGSEEWDYTTHRIVMVG